MLYFVLVWRVQVLSGCNTCFQIWRDVILMSEEPWSSTWKHVRYWRLGTQVSPRRQYCVSTGFHMLHHVAFVNLLRHVMFHDQPAHCENQEAVACLQTANGAALLVNVGHVQRSLGDPDAALTTYKEARGLFKASGSWDTPAGAECRRLIGMLSA
eukprot:Skav225850  [mRNA]  locus=scaffold345:199051:199515:+ [translate_table: standard]